MRHRKYFPQLETLKEKANNNQLQTIFSDCHWFDGTLTYVDSDNQEQHYPNFNFNPQKLYTYWSTMYETMRVGYACKTANIWSGPTQEEWNNCAAELTTKAKLWLDLNQAKFLSLIKTYGYKYDPISNYSMTELKGSASKLANQVTDSKLNGTLTTTTTPATMKTSNYTTTYESAAENRLANYVVQEPLNGSQTTENSTGNDYGTKVTTGFKDGNNTNVVEFEGGEMKSYLETPEGNQVSTAKTERKGNIGVTSTQEMIEQEREIAKQNILEEFFKEFNKGVMLQSWAY